MALKKTRICLNENSSTGLTHPICSGNARTPLAFPSSIGLYYPMYLWNRDLKH